MTAHVKTPWYRHYDGVKAHLEYPDDSVYRMLKNSADRHPDYFSYNYYGNKKTYQQLVRQVDRCAGAFWQLGVRAGDRVTICMPNTPEAVISFYALSKLGAAANMVHPLSAQNELSYYLKVSESRILVTIDLAFSKILPIIGETGLTTCILVSVKDSMPAPLKLAYQLTRGRNVAVPRAKEAISWKQFMNLAKGKEDQPVEHGAGEQVAAILYTGGTTGYPKGIELTNYNFNALAMQSIEACQCLEGGDRVLAIMPVFHGFGLGICIHTVQCFGGCSILLPQFRADTFHKLLKKYRPNIIAGVPTLYEALLRNKQLESYDLSFLKCVISGGDTLSVSLKQKLDRFLQSHHADLQIREGYGLTECVTGSCLTPMRQYKEGSIGIPYPDTYYKIVKPDTEEELAYGAEGEILISGPTVMKGYLNNEAETRAVLRTHQDGRIWLYTGDLGYMDEDGFVYFKQRIKRMIISSGYSLSPQYIENVIDAHPAVLMSCVIGIDHAYKGQVVKAFVVPKDPAANRDELLLMIRAHCEERLARFSWPYEYELRNQLPKTLVGKIAYNQLLEEEMHKREGTQEEGFAGASGDIQNEV